MPHAACRMARDRAEVPNAELAAEQRTVQRLCERFGDERTGVRRLQGRSWRSMIAGLPGRRDDLPITERTEAATAEAELATSRRGKVRPAR